MKSKKLYILAVIALLNSCITNNTVNNSVVTPPPEVRTNQSVIDSSKPEPIKESENKPEEKFFSLSSEQIKKVSESGLVKASNNFGLKLFMSLEKSENVFMSPTSIFLLLNMIYNGADDETRDTILKVFELNNLSLDEINNINYLLINKLNKPASDINLKVSNSVWVNNAKFQEQFKNDIAKFYISEINSLNFSDPETLNLINKWAYDKTNGKIEKALKSLEDTSSVLMNAIYFKADWTRKFKTSDTQQREFMLNNDQKKTVYMMSDFRNFKYYKNYNNYNKNNVSNDLKFEAAEVPYGKDEKVSLYIFLPDKESSLEKFYTQLNNDNINKWIDGFYNETGYISFPKFKVKWNKELKSNINDLGINLGFLSRMTYIEEKLSGIAQHAFIDVNEEGTEAVALSVATAAASSAPQTRFVADRPFFYLIRDNETKSILFMGAVNNPEYEK